MQEIPFVQLHQVHILHAHIFHQAQDFRIVFLTLPLQDSLNKFLLYIHEELHNAAVEHCAVQL